MVNTSLQHLFSTAYILGGSPCSGKSTVAEMLSAQYGFQYYKADDHESEHMRRACSDQQPIMFKYSKMDWDEIWSQTPEKLFADEIAYYHERFPLILDDLKQLAAGGPIIFEGAAFLPDLVHHYPAKPENVVFMISTTEFQLRHYSQRLWISSILSECHEPQQAFANWMKRDELFAHEVAQQANAYRYKVVIVDGSIDIHQQFECIKTQFKLS